jgi:hypothetical protein
MLLFFFDMDISFIGCDSMSCRHHRSPAEADGVKKRKQGNDQPFEKIRLIRDAALRSVLTS